MAVFDLAAHGAVPERRSQAPFLIVGLVLVATLAGLLSGCSSRPPRYEAVARIGYTDAGVDLHFESAFLRAEQFLGEVFDRLSESQLKALGATNADSLSKQDRYRLFRHFVNQASVRQAAKSRTIEICFEDEDADCSTEIANKIASVYLSVREDQAYLAERAHRPKAPK